MKNKRLNLAVKAVIGVSVAGVVALAGWIGTAFLGNPVTEYKVKKAAEQYIAETYSDLNLEITDSFFEFKASDYVVKVQSPDSEDTGFRLVYDHKGDFKYDEYDWRPIWNAVSRFEDAAEKEIEPALIKEFGEKSDPWISLANGTELAEAGLITVDQPVDLDNFPFEIDVHLDVFSDDENRDGLISETVKRTDNAVDDRFTVNQYSMSIYDADGIDLVDTVFITAVEAKAMYE